MGRDFLSTTKFIDLSGLGRLGLDAIDPRHWPSGRGDEVGRYTYTTHGISR